MDLPDVQLDAPCTDDQWICQQAYDLTGSRPLANISQDVVGVGLSIIGLVIFGLVLRWVLHRLIDRLVQRAVHGVLPERVARVQVPGESRRTGAVADSPGFSRRKQRAETMGTLLKSIVTGVVTAIVGTMILSAMGVNIAPIIASAGIIGLAIGFGAQSLVTDFLSGLFMIFEDQYGVGDAVDLGEAVGTVEAVSLRVTRVRAVDGTVWYVRNGEIVRVGNQSQNWARTVLDVNVDYGEDLAKVRSVLTEVAHGLWDDEEYRGIILEEPEVWGVQDMTPIGIQMRLVLKTAPMEQWAVAREMRQRIKARFDYEGIEMPHQQWATFHPEPAAPGEGS